MKIILGNDYFVEVDSLNWTLKKTIHVDEHKRNGKLIEAHDNDVTIGYYGNFKQTAKGLLRHYQNEQSEDLILTVDKYVNYVNKANEQAVKSMVEAFERFRLEQ